MGTPKKNVEKSEWDKASARQPKIEGDRERRERNKNKTVKSNLTR